MRVCNLPNKLKDVRKLASLFLDAFLLMQVCMQGRLESGQEALCYPTQGSNGILSMAPWRVVHTCVHTDVVEVNGSQEEQKEA